LYFLLGGLLERLVYLHYGIAFILAFIGVKLVLHAAHDNELPFINGGQHIEWIPDIDTWTSLGVILGSMVVAIVASLIKMRRDQRKGIAEPPHLGPADEDESDDEGPHRHRPRISASDRPEPGGPDAPAGDAPPRA